VGQGDDGLLVAAANNQAIVFGTEYSLGIACGIRQLAQPTALGSAAPRRYSRAPRAPPPGPPPLSDLVSAPSQAPQGARRQNGVQLSRRTPPPDCLKPPRRLAAPHLEHLGRVRRGVHVRGDLHPFRAVVLALQVFQDDGIDVLAESDLSSTEQFASPASIALNMSGTPSTETIRVSLPGCRPASFMA